MTVKDLLISAKECAAAPALEDGGEIALRTPRHLYDLSLYYDAIADISASADTRKISAKRPLQNATVSWVAFWLCRKTDCHTRFAGSQ